LKLLDETAIAENTPPNKPLDKRGLKSNTKPEYSTTITVQNSSLLAFDNGAVVYPDWDCLMGLKKMNNPVALSFDLT
jgi:hypothetical protein